MELLICLVHLLLKVDLAEIQPNYKSSWEQPLQFKIGRNPYNVCPALQSSWISRHCLWTSHLCYAKDIYILSHLSLFAVLWLRFIFTVPMNHFLCTTFSTLADSQEIAAEYLDLKEHLFWERGYWHIPKHWCDLLRYYSPHNWRQRSKCKHG